VGVAWVVLCWPWLSGRWTIPWDAKAHFLPQIQFLAQSLARGDSPAWAPYVFSGHPQIADPQAMIFSPPFLGLALLDGNPGLWSADATLLVMVLLGAASLVLWAHDREWHWAGTALTGLVFAFGAAMAWRIQHVGQVLSCVYLAMTLLLLARALERGSLVYGLLAGVTGGLMLLGRDQVALLGAYLLAAYAVCELVSPSPPSPLRGGDGGGSLQLGFLRRVNGSIGPVAAGVVGGALVVAVPLLLTALVAAESNRPAIDLEGAGRGSLHPALLLTLIAPDLFGAAGRMEDYWGPPSFAWQGTGLYIAQNVGILYVGALPALLVAIGAMTGRLWDREIRFFTIAALVMLVYALGWYTPLFALMHKLPGVDLFRRPADAVFHIGLLLAVLGGYVLHRLMREVEPRVAAPHILIILAGLAACFVAAVAIGIRLDRLPRTTIPLLTAGLFFAAAAAALAAAFWLKPIRPWFAGLLPIAATAADLAWGNGPTTSSAMPYAYYEVLDPQTRNPTIALLKQKVAESASTTRRDRVELLGLGFHWPNASMTHRLENTLGYNPLRLGLYSRATGADDHVGLPDQRRFSPLFPSYRSPLADLLGLRFIAAGAPIETIDKTLQPGDLALLARLGDHYVYENPRAMPRVMFATRAERADFNEMLTTGSWPPVDLKSTVLLEDAPPETALPRQSGRVHLAGTRNTEIVIEVDSPDGGFVVLNDVWHPWWRVEVGGKPAALLRANVLFRAVEVPAGRHVVRFTFAPLRSLRDTLLRNR
jgi:hypothetical protein